MERNLSAMRCKIVSYSAVYKEEGVKEKNNETVSIIRSKGLGCIKLISSKIEILKLGHCLRKKTKRRHFKTVEGTTQCCNSPGTCNLRSIIKM
jgi:hypothetical protein